MVFIVLGTWTMPFYRPLKEIEKLLEKKILKDKIIVQTGYTPYKSELMEICPFFSPTDFDNLFQNASFVIVQAGIGSIMNGLKYNKKVIAIPRLQKYSEHVDNHQLEILNLFSQKGYIKAWNEKDNVENIILKINTFSPIPYPFATEKISDTIIDFLENQ
jgi:UDP-N-acetylglucosamine transferase subunit ALG13